MFENRRLRLAATSMLFGSSLCGSCGIRAREAGIRDLLQPPGPALAAPLSVEPVGSAAWRMDLIAQLTVHPEFLKLAGPEAQAERAIVKAAVSANGLALRWAAAALTRDSEIALAACRRTPAAFHLVEETLRFKNDFILSALQVNGRVLFELPPPFRSERRYALCALRTDAGIFPQLTKELREDDAFLERALIENSNAIKEIPEARRTRRLCRIALSLRPELISAVPRALMKSAEDGKMLASLAGTGALKVIPCGTDAYREAVCALAAASLQVLDEIPPAAKSDIALAGRLVAMNGEALQFFSDKLKDNPEIARAAVQSKAGSAYPFVSRRLREDRALALLACSRQTSVYHHLPDGLKRDPEIIAAALARDPLALSDAPLEYRRDRNLILRLVRKDGFAILGADDNFLEDSQLLAEAVHTSPLLMLSLAPLAANIPLYRAAVEREPVLIWDPPGEVREDLALARSVLPRLPRALGCFGASVNSNPQLVKAVLLSLPDYQNLNVDDVRDLKRMDERVRRLLAAEKPAEAAPFLNECARQEQLAEGRLSRDRALLEAYDCLRNVPIDVFRDADLARLAVSKQPDIALKLAKAGLLDPQTAACAVSHRPSLVRELPLSMQRESTVLQAVGAKGVLGMVGLDAGISNEPAKVLQAVREDGLALIAAGPSAKQDRTCVLRAVEQNGSALEAASYELRWDKAVVMAAVKNWGGAIESALYVDDDVIRIASESYGAALRYAPIVSDRKLAWTAFGTSAEGYGKLDSVLKGDRELALRAVRLDPAVLLEADGELLKDPGFLLAVADTSLAARPYLRHLCGTLPAAVEKRFHQVERAVLELGIHRPRAFDASGEVIRGRFAAADPALKNRLRNLLGEAFFECLKTDQRPVAVLLFPAHDHNHAFDAQNGGFDLVDQLSGHYQVCYFEVSGTQQFAQSIRSATIDQRRRAKLLFVAAHGTQERVQMGWAGEGPQAGLSIGAGPDLAKLSPALEWGGLVVMFGCNTAKGAEWMRPGIARLFGELWKQADIQAPVDAVVAVIRLNRDGSLRGLQYYAPFGGGKIPSPAFVRPHRQ